MGSARAGLKVEDTVYKGVSLQTGKVGPGKQLKHDTSTPLDKILGSRAQELSLIDW